MIKYPANDPETFPAAVSRTPTDHRYEPGLYGVCKRCGQERLGRYIHVGDRQYARAAHREKVRAYRPKPEE